MPPHIHRRNAAERAIRTYKNHLISGLYTCDPKFPSRGWDQLLPQCNITINLLRSERHNPSLSAYAALLVSFNFNATPMSPRGTKVIVHEKVNNRLSWEGHGTEAWYIGPSLEQDRCFKFYMPVTCRKQYADTVEFFPTTTPFPRVSTDDYLRQGATDLVQILRVPGNNIPSLTYGSTTTNEYIHPAKIFKQAATPPKTVTTIQHDAHSPRVIPVSPSVTKEPRVVPETKHIHDKTVLQKHVAAEPILKHKTTQHHTIPLLHCHPVVQNKRRLLGRLRPAKSRINRLAKAVVKNSHFQAQSVQNIEEYHGHWACPVYHPETRHKQSLYSLLKEQESPTWTTYLINEVGRLAQGIGKNRPAHEKIEGKNTINFIKRRAGPKECKSHIC